MTPEISENGFEKEIADFLKNIENTEKVHKVLKSINTAGFCNVDMVLEARDGKRAIVEAVHSHYSFKVPKMDNYDYYIIVFSKNGFDLFFRKLFYEGFDRHVFSKSLDELEGKVYAMRKFLDGLPTPRE